MSKIELINCPILKKNIDVAYCIELQMIANEEVKPTDDEKYITDDEWNFCRNCIKQECPVPDDIINREE